MKTKNVLAIVVVAMLALVIGQVQAEMIEINGDFKMYKPGTNYTVRARSDAGNFWTQGIGDDLTVLNGLVVDYDDGTTGTVVDCPGWVTPITVVKDTGEDFITAVVQLFQPSEVPDGTSALNCFGGWSGGSGNLAESSEPLGIVQGGATYTLSAIITNDADPITLELRAGGVAMTPSSSVTPVAPAGWEVISRTYDADAVAPHAGKSLTIRVGTTPPGVDGSPELTGSRAKIDNITLEVTGLMYPSPEYGEMVYADEALELSWTNLAVADSNDVAWVDVWFGTEPNELDPGYDITRIVTAGENTASVIVDASALGTYYWQVNSYLNGADNINDANMVKGGLWNFIATDDMAPTVEIVTGAQKTWSGGGVPLDSTVTDDAVSTLTIEWTADDVSLADPNLTIEILNADQADPTVTITKAEPTGDVVTVTMTVTVGDVATPEANAASVEIDVYDDACHVARVGEGKSDIADFDGNCITGLEDVALIAAEWLNDYSTTGPIDRL